MNEIVYCPFCGKTKTKIEYKTKRLYYPSIQVTCTVRCNCCHARGSTVTKVFQVTQFKGDLELEQQAIDKWNTRA